MNLTGGRATLLALTLAITACESPPTAPALDVDVPDPSLATEQAQNKQRPPLLHHLFEQAIARVKKEKGDDAAIQLAAAYVKLRREARAAHGAGDVESARKKMQEAQVEAARVVARVLPEAAERVLHMVRTDLAALNTRIANAEANGRNVTRVKEIAQRIARLVAAAGDDLQNGRVVSALLHGTHAADLLAPLRHR